jgi:uncharacterized protein YkwD
MKFKPQNRRTSRSGSQNEGHIGHVLLVLAILGFGSPILQFTRQLASGYPLDLGFFESELSPQKLFNFGLYNGKGGDDWTIGQPLTTVRRAGIERSIPELRAFALELVNRDRTLNGVSPLVPNTDLDLAAQLHAQDMYDRDYFDHTSPEGSSPLDRYLAVAQNLMTIGENIAFYEGVLPAQGLSERQLEDLQRGWMYSNGHRANVLESSFTDFGFAVVVGTDGRLYAVQLFGG